jgi:hypothetical protein
MLWFFEREEQSLRLETRYDNDTSEFVAVVRYQDGREHTERFTALDEFRSWLLTFESRLDAERWTNQSGAIILPYGWPNKRLT